MQLEGHAAPITDLCFGPDGRLATSSYDKSIRVWDAHAGEQLVSLTGGEVPISHLSRGLCLVCTCGCSCTVFLLPSCTCTSTCTCTCNCHCNLYLYLCLYLYMHPYLSVRRSDVWRSQVFHSLDYHPVRADLLCSSDGDGNLCLWAIGERSGSLTTTIHKTAYKQARFQVRTADKRAQVQVRSDVQVQWG